jgi:sigma-B regulation protein RsbU (phosphoserine phosphatase)
VRVLVAEDDFASRLLLQTMLSQWGFEVLLAADGVEAWQMLSGPDAPPLAMLDWMMPGMDGLTICRRLREAGRTVLPYVIMLTARGTREDLLTGLESGADEYIVKPFDPEELRARCRAGGRIVELVQELEKALARVKQLQGLLPICSYCHRIRDDKNYWQRVETYIAGHSEARFSHGICPDCYESVIKPEIEKRQAAANGNEPAAHV